MPRLIFAALLPLLLIAPASGEPWQRHTIDRSSQGADGVRLADANGDGRLDITTGWEEGGTIRVYLQPTADQLRQPWPAVTVGKVKSPEDAVFADLDGDGGLDVVSSCEGGNRTVYFHWAPKDRAQYLKPDAWKTEAVPCTAKQQMWMFAAPLNIDGRNGIDLVVSSKGKDASIGWLEAPADARKVADWKYHRLYDAGWIMSLFTVDMDGDGDLDILSSDRKGKHRGVLWLANPGTKEAAAGMKWEEHRIGGENLEVMFLDYADLDGDKRPDVIVATRNGKIHWFHNAGNNPWQESEIDNPFTLTNGKSVRVGDIDLDGKPDVVHTTGPGGGAATLPGVAWLRYEKSPADTRWQEQDISGPEGIKFDRIELLDLDGDGDLDVITCEERHNLGVFWYENPTRAP